MRKRLWQYWRHLDPRHINVLDTAHADAAWVYAFMQELAWSSLLEVGCGPGKNLRVLREHGDVTGIDIRPVDTDLNIHCGPAELLVERMDPHDVVLTVAFLEHVPPASEGLFRDIAAVARKYIVTVEDEYHNGERHFARNYQEVFEPLGFRQIKHEAVPIEGALHGFQARILEKT